MAERVSEPKYTLVTKIGDVEVRRYEPTVRAVTVVEGKSWSASLNEGFRRLAGYIFGGNKTRASIAMTAPVTASTTTTKIAMTAPVTAQPEGEGAVRVAFTMPEGSALETLPIPDDAQVTLEAVPARDVAVLPFSGFAGDAKRKRESAALLNALAGSGFRPVTVPELARYDPPWTIPFLRRNEVAVEVAAARQP